MWWIYVKRVAPIVEYKNKFPPESVFKFFSLLRESRFRLSRVFWRQIKTDALRNILPPSERRVTSVFALAFPSSRRRYSSWKALLCSGVPMKYDLPLRACRQRATTYLNYCLLMHIYVNPGIISSSPPSATFYFPRPLALVPVSFSLSF